MARAGTPLGSRAKIMPEREKAVPETGRTRAIPGVDSTLGADNAAVYYIIYLHSLIAISCLCQYCCFSNQEP